MEKPSDQWLLFERTPPPEKRIELIDDPNQLAEQVLTEEERAEYDACTGSIVEARDKAPIDVGETYII